MPPTPVYFYCDETGASPVLEALESLAESGRRKVVAKCWIRIERLAKKGYELQRPEAAYLRNGIYELRIVHRGVHFRILYFFHGGGAVLSHLIRKEGKVPPGEIDRATRDKERFEADPKSHMTRR